MTKILIQKLINDVLDYMGIEKECLCGSKYLGQPSWIIVESHALKFLLCNRCQSKLYKSSLDSSCKHITELSKSNLSNLISEGI